jgi:hypothetical protein
MQMTLFTRRFAAWAACLAMLMSALAPSVSHALALGRGVNIVWMVVCSVRGAKLVEADGVAKETGKPASQDALGQAGYCPFCSTHAASFALPPAAAALFQVAGGKHVRPLLFYQSPEPLAIWSNAHSRAPPLFS